jgi:hypothetical protein
MLSSFEPEFVSSVISAVIPLPSSLETPESFTTLVSSN